MTMLEQTMFDETAWRSGQRLQVAVQHGCDFYPGWRATRAQDDACQVMGIGDEYGNRIAIPKKLDKSNTTEIVTH